MCFNGTAEQDFRCAPLYFIPKLASAVFMKYQIKYLLLLTCVQIMPAGNRKLFGSFVKV